MADLSELNNTLKSLNANISTNNALLSRQAATKTVSDRLEQSRKQEEQREAERRKRLEGSGGGTGGTGGGSDGSGIPGGARGFISRIFSGKIGLALLGIGGFAALASRMGGGGNALRKLLDSTIGVLLKIVQEVAAMTADFIGATDVGKAIRNFDLQKYINKSLNWLYDPKKEGAKAWFGGIPAQISELYNQYFTDERRKSLSDTFEKIFKFIYNKNGEGEFVDKVFGGIFRPIENVRKAIVDAYSGTEGEGFTKFTNFFYNPTNGKILGGLLDDTIDTLKDNLKILSEKMSLALNNTFKQVALFTFDLFNNISKKLPEAIFNNLPDYMQDILFTAGQAPARFKAEAGIQDIQKEISDIESEMNKMISIRDNPKTPARSRGGLNNKINELQQNIDEKLEERKKFEDILNDREGIENRRRIETMFDRRAEDIRSEGSNQYDTPTVPLMSTPSSDRESVTRYLALNLFGRDPNQFVVTEQGKQLLIKTSKRGDSIPGFKDLNPAAKGGLLQAIMYMSDSEFEQFKNSELLRTAIQNKDYKTLSGLVPEYLPVGPDAMGTANIRDLISSRTDLTGLDMMKDGAGTNVVVTDNSVTDNSTNTVSGGSPSKASASAFDNQNIRYNQYGIGAG